MINKIFVIAACLILITDTIGLGIAIGIIILGGFGILATVWALCVLVAAFSD